MSIDQTGHGYSPGGGAPTQADRDALRTQKYEMGRMLDSMQQIDPVLNRKLEIFAKTQLPRGADPTAIRKFAFDSVPGQLASDTLMAARRNGLLGSGDPVNYAANIMQGVAGGGFGMDMLNPAGRSVGMNQRVTGAGPLAGQVATQLSRDVLTNLYGKDSADPARLYGHNMEDASQVFRTLAERGALGNVATYKRYADKGDNAYNSATAIRDKVENGMRQEVNKPILAALEGTTADNIDERIAKAVKDGETKVASALTSFRDARGTTVLDDKNTKRVTDTTREVLKGLSNLKEVYSEMNNPALLNQLESLSGIRITNQSEARRANTMAQQVAGAATASGHDPRAVMDMLISRAAQNSQLFGQALGFDGSEGSVAKEATQGLGAAVTTGALASASTADYLRTTLNNTIGTNLSGRSLDKFQIDDERQTAKFMETNKAFVLTSGMAQGSQKDNTDFVAKQREISDLMASGKMREANQASESLIQSTLKVTSRAYGLTSQGRSDNAAAEADELVRQAKIVSAGQSETYLSDGIMRDNGLTPDEVKTASSTFKREIGVFGMSQFMNKEKTDFASQEATDKAITDMRNDGSIDATQEAAIRRVLSTSSKEEFAQQITDVGNASGGYNSRYELGIGAMTLRDNVNTSQRNIYSDEGGLSIKGIARAIFNDPDKNGIKTDSQKLLALEAMQASGLDTGMGPVARMDVSGGYSKEQMEKIREISKDSKFEIHTELGFSTEEAMLAAQNETQEGKQLKIRMDRALQKSGKFVLGGTTKDRTIANSEDVNNGVTAERISNFQLAIQYDAMNGLKPGEFSAEANDIMRDGKLKDGSVKASVDGLKEGAFTSTGKRTNGDSNDDRVHLKNLSRLSRLADGATGPGAEAFAEFNEKLGGEPLRQMEEELKVAQHYKSQGIEFLQSKDANGNREVQAVDDVIKKFTEVIAKVKNNGKDEEEVKQMMTVTNLYVTGNIEKTTK